MGQDGPIAIYDDNGQRKQAYFLKEGMEGGYFCKAVEGLAYWAFIKGGQEKSVQRLLPYQESPKQDFLIDATVVPTISMHRGAKEKPCAIFKVSGVEVCLHTDYSVDKPLYNTPNRLIVQRKSNGYFGIDFTPLDASDRYEVIARQLGKYKRSDNKEDVYILAKTPDGTDRALVKSNLAPKNYSIISAKNQGFPAWLSKNKEGWWVIEPDVDKIIELGNKLSELNIPLEYIREENRKVEKENGHTDSYLEYIFHGYPPSSEPTLLPIVVKATSANLALYGVNTSDLETSKIYQLSFTGSVSSGDKEAKFVNFKVGASKRTNFHGIAMSHGEHETDQSALTMELVKDMDTNQSISERTKIPYELLRQNGVWDIEKGTKISLSLKRKEPNDKWEEIEFYGDIEGDNRISSQDTLECTVVNDWHVRNPNCQLPFKAMRPGKIDFKKPNQTFGWANHCLTYINRRGVLYCVVIHASLLKFHKVETLNSQSRIWLTVQWMIASVHTQKPIPILVANTIEQVEEGSIDREERILRTVTAKYYGQDPNKGNGHIFKELSTEEEIKFTDYDNTLGKIPALHKMEFRLKINQKNFVNQIISAVKK